MIITLEANNLTCEVVKDDESGLSCLKLTIRDNQGEHVATVAPNKMGELLAALKTIEAANASRY